MLPKDTKARLLAISIAIVYFLFNVYAISTFLEVDKARENYRPFLVDLFVINTETYATYFLSYP